MNSIREHILDGTPEDVVRRYESLPSLAEVSDFGVLDDNVVVIDTETTGLSFSHDELIQIAAARISKGRVEDWYVTFVNPGKPIPDDIVTLTGITDADVAGALSVGEALAGLVEFADDAIMVAHNAQFDRTFVTAHPAGYPLLENVWLDSLEMSRIALPRLRSHRLIDLVRTFGAPTSTHRADDDVAATCVVYRILLAGISTMPPSLLRAIADMATVDVWPTVYAFKTLEERQAERSLECINDTITENAKTLTYPQVQRDVSRENIEPLHSEERDMQDGPQSQHGVAAESLPPADGVITQIGIGDTKQDATNQSKVAFSLHALRCQRITSLPTIKSKRDADALVGQLVFPDDEDVAHAFTPDGILGRIYPDYEPREEQRSMAMAINDACRASENLVVEAGTGVGKSMAYLIPAVLAARQNNIGVGVATKTNSLLDQLVFQELPALARALEEIYPQAEPLTWAPLKGMAHYPCLRKVARLVDNGPGFREVAGKEVTQAPALAALLSYIEQSEFDDIDSLKIDYRTLPRYMFTTSSAECLRRKCPFFGKLCFVHGARRRAETADVIVTNHSLLFCDVAADGGLLPTVRHWVVDEAHAAESEARSAFAQTVDSEAIARLVSRVGVPSSSRNVFTRAERSVSGNEAGEQTLFFGLSGKAKAAGSDFARAAEEYLVRIKDLLYFDPVKRTKRGQSYEHVDIWINDEVRSTAVFSDVALCVANLIESADKLIKASQDVVAYLEGVDEAAVAQREIAACTMELRDLRNAAEIIFQQAPANYAYQVTLNRKKDRKTDRVQALLLDVGDMMNETFYAMTHSVVYTSATLTVGGKFDSFNNAMGLNRSDLSQARTLQLDSSYDFDNNMIVYVVSDIPEPNDPAYADALNDLLIKVHRAQQGSMLTLFTNRREMERSHDVVSTALKQDDLRVACQRYGVSVKGLRDDFLKDEHLSLFALKSFWEGFDAPGATLKGVVIPKLPFGRPTDPLYCERAARDDRAWWKYVLPQAVIETKQAAGRLIRRADDRGVLILADKRLLTKSYGKTFLGSLQSKTVRVSTIDEIASALSVMSAW